LLTFYFNSFELVSGVLLLRKLNKAGIKYRVVNL